MNRENKILKYIEWGLFYGSILYLIGMIFGLGSFHTMDGASHTENARIMRDLLLGSDPNDAIHQHYRMNWIPFPNWMGHIVLFFLGFIFEGTTSMKIVLAGDILFFSIMFRKLVIQLIPKGEIPWYSIFGVLFSANVTLLYFGFIGFNFSMIAWLGMLLFYYQRKDKPKKISYWLILSLLFILTYFCHLLGFLVSFVTLFWIFIFEKEKAKSTTDWLKIKFVKLFYFGCSVLPCAILYMIYHKENMSPMVLHWMPFKENLKTIYSANFITDLGSSPDSFFLWRLFGLIRMIFSIVILICFLFTSFIFVKRALDKKEVFSVNQLTWFALSLGGLICYFLMPDSDGRGSMTTERYELMVFVMATIFISQTDYRAYIRYLILPFPIYFILFLPKRVTDDVVLHNNVFMELTKSAKYIPDNSVVHELNYRLHWRDNHYLGYLCTDNKIIHTDNYEACQFYFPILFNWDYYPNYKLYDIPLKEICQNPQFVWHSCEHPTEIKRIDYVVVVWKEAYKTGKNDCADGLIDYIKSKNATKVYSGNLIDVYKVNE